MTSSDTRIAGRPDVVDAPPVRPAPRAGRTLRRLAAGVLVAAGCAALFLGYLRMSRTQPTNSDGASNALQAWDMLHGNLLLRGWTLSDVSFYTTELPQYALVDLVYGLRADVVHVAAALTYTLLVLAAAVLARGRARGVAGLARAGVAVAILLVPEAGTGYLTLLNSPDHTGTSVPVLVTWIVLERGLTRPDGTRREPARWLSYLLGLLLTWGVMGDSLVIATGVLPLLLVSALRLARPGTGSRRARLRGTGGRLLAAGLGGLLLAEAGLLAVRLAGGFAVHGLSVRVAGFGRLGRNAWNAVVGLATNFAGYPPDAHGPGALAIVALHLVGLVAVVVAAVLVAVRTVRAAVRRRAEHPTEQPDGWVAPLLAFGVLANLGAFVFSTLPVDQLSARQIVSVLPLGAALAGRVYGPLLTASLRAARRYLPVLGAALLASVIAFGAQTVAAGPVPAANENIAEWLLAHRLTYGLGGYWSANVVTLTTGGRVRVVPVSGAAERKDLLLAYRWESRSDWFDPARHDARFVVIDLNDPAYGRIDAAEAQFGRPVGRQDFPAVTGAGRFAVLLYDHNLLVGLPALCRPGRIAPSMAQCPRG